MLEEHQLIPYQTSPLPEGPWLVFAPHPDDETFGMGGSLLLAARQGIDTTLVILTDGALGGELENESLAALREKEAKEAAHRLGIGEIQFWRQEDRKLQATATLINRTAALVERLRPASIFFPSPMELHPDHRTTALLVWEGLRCSKFSGDTAYAYEISVQSQVNRLIDITPVLAEKRSIMGIYKSQLTENNYVSVVLALNKARTYTLRDNITHAEGFFAYSEPTHGDLSSQTRLKLQPYWQLENAPKSPLVSVIIRTKNRPRMLAKALNSLVEQTHPNIEALVINDGGKDVAEVIRSFDGLLTKARYIDLGTNRGRTAAANVGLQEATGEYFIFLDDDDWFYPEHIAKLVAVLEKDETHDLAYTAVECVQEEAPGEWKRIHVFDESFDPTRLLTQNFIPMHAALFRRELVESGCRLDTTLELYEDWDFWVQVAQKTPFRHVDGITAAYRIAGSGGFGVSGDQSLVQLGLEAFFEKWRHLWSTKQLFSIIEYAKHEPGFQLLKKELEIREQYTKNILADLEQTKANLHRTKSKLDKTQGNFENTKHQLDQTTEILNQTRHKLDETTRNFKNTKYQLDQTTEILNQTSRKLEKTRSDLENTTRVLNSVRCEQDRAQRENARLNAKLNQTTRSGKAWATRAQQMEKSHSWRITKPLRAVSIMVRNLYTSVPSGSNPSRHEPGQNRQNEKRPEPAQEQIFGKTESPPVSAKKPLISPCEIINVEDGNIQQLVTELKFHCHENPSVSVIIPVFNKIEYTLCCLASISKYPPDTSFEIIVVDDGSTDATEEIIQSVSNIRYIKNQENLGFLRSSNKGISLARGKYIMFLNNDTQVFPGWLDELVKVFSLVPDVGIVGSKLIYPSGHLQESGAVLKQDGTVQLIGLNDDPNNPKYNVMREVDHCSGASLLMERELLRQLEGFDELYAPAYFEDCDLSLRARELGKKIIYQPTSVVMHHLSVTTTKSAGGKMQQVEINKKKYLHRWQSTLNELDKVRAIAFYLPQYHPIPENDEWWGKGFTEWANVTKARPNFEGHYQPRLPTDLGFYDLRLPEARERQAELARQHGIYGFCYYYYWFDGRRLLHYPLDEVLRLGKPDFPFCICWANENWTRRWDGLESEILIAQHYSDADNLSFIKSLVPALQDKRYIKINGKPLLLVYRVSLLPNPQRTAEIWREHCQNTGLGEIYLASVQSFGATANPEDFGFDAAVEFPPHNLGVIMNPRPNITNPIFTGKLYDYVQTAKKFMNRPPMPYTWFRGVMPSWDNTARRQDSGHIFVNAEPEHYGRWLRHIVEETRALKFGDERLVFINAWNEWAEGNYLEPDTKFGHGYLEATRNAIGHLAPTTTLTFRKLPSQTNLRSRKNTAVVQV